MYPKLLTLYGPFELNSYNTSIMLGIALFLYLADRHPSRAEYMSSSAFFNLCIESALTGILGARILHIVTSLQEYPTLVSMLRIWDGGLSILGGFSGVLLFSSIRLYHLKVPFAPVADIAGLYAPLIHCIARIGCFLVGCCHGAPTTSFLGVTYTDPRVLAPLNVPLHPSQLYSSAFYLCLFIILYLIYKFYKPHPGTIALVYIIGMSLERFLIDFTRGDRIMIESISHLSFYQVISLGIFVAALSILLVRQRMVRTHESL